MIRRALEPAAAMAAIFAVASLGVQAHADTPTSADDADADAGADYAAPRTPWGDPDLQGAWDYRTITPLERPPRFGDRAFYTEEEIAELEDRAARRLDEPPDPDAPANLVHAQYMVDPGRHVDESRRTSLIIDPPNGRIPPLTPEAEAQRAQRGGATAQDGPPDPADVLRSRSPLERCIVWGLPQALLPGLYNNNIRIVQAPGYATIVHEMVHDARVVPLDGRPFSGTRTWLGESRGYWEGDTLVVETRNFNGRASYRGAGENLRLTERYTRAGPERIDFQLTIEDETHWVEPWTVTFSMRPTDGDMYEYACHEGNYALRHILENARDEARAAEADPD